MLTVFAILVFLRVQLRHWEIAYRKFSIDCGVARIVNCHRGNIGSRTRAVRAFRSAVHRVFTEGKN